MNDKPESRSILRRKAIQKGEPMPEFSSEPETRTWHKSPRFPQVFCSCTDGKDSVRDWLSLDKTNALEREVEQLRTENEKLLEYVRAMKSLGVAEGARAKYNAYDDLHHEGEPRQGWREEYLILSNARDRAAEKVHETYQAALEACAAHDARTGDAKNET